MLGGNMTGGRGRICWKATVSYALVFLLMMDMLTPALPTHASDIPYRVSLNGTDGWNDTFDDMSKVSASDNVSVLGGAATLYRPVRGDVDGTTWQKQGMVVDVGGVYDSVHSYAPTVINDAGTYKMWYQGYDGSSIRILYATSPDGVTWTKQGLALNYGGTYADNSVLGPCVLKVGNEYKMWYNGYDGTNKRILYANSSDGVTWQKQGLVLNIGGAGEDQHVSNPSVLIDSDGTYKMWYNGNAGGSNMFLATSPDGVNWTKQGLVMAYGASYEDSSIYGPTVISYNSTYHMWYSGKDGSGRVRILYATSQDGVTWDKKGLALDYGQVAYEDDGVDNPAVLIENDTAKMWYTGNDWSPSHSRVMYATSLLMIWEKQGVALPLSAPSATDGLDMYYPHVLKDGGVYKMWYAGKGSAPQDHWRIHLAVSADGESWTKKGVVVDLGLSGGTDSAHVTSPFVIKEGATYKMWYAGHDGSNYRVHYATSADGENWTGLGVVLDIGNFGDLDDTGIIAPCVIYDGGQYKMWYTGMDGSTGRIFLATSPDGVTWTKQGMVLDMGLPGALDDSGAWDPSVNMRGDNTYEMWYRGSPGTGEGKILYATSPDGAAWTRGGLALDTGASGATDDARVVTPTILFDDDGYAKMWYGGNDGSDYRIHYARAELGSWETKGNLTSEGIDLPAGMLWSSVNLTKDEPGTGNFINVSVLDSASGLPIAGYSDLTGMNIDISGINSSLYPSIKLQADFTGNGSASPTLYEWSVHWKWDGTTPIINHTAVASANISEVINITAELSDDTAVTGASLGYKNVGDTDFTVIPMVLVSGTAQRGNWSADIPAQTLPGTVYYYINATDGTLNSSHPPAGPADPHSISILDNMPPDITHVPIGSAATGGTAVANCTVTDASAISAVNLEYWFDTPSGPTAPATVPMNDLGGGNYDYAIPVRTDALVLHYNISARDSSWNWNWTGIVSVNVTDTIPPSITDTTAGSPVAGNTYTVSADVSDNIGVASVNLYYYFDTATGTTSLQNVPMTYLGGSSYDLGVPVPYNAVWFYYNISASDTSALLSETGSVALAVIDGTPPDIMDTTAGTPTTGDNFTVTANVVDNIAVDAVCLVYEFTTGAGLTPLQNVSMADHGGDSYSVDVPVPDNALSFRYNITANDTSGNWNETGMLLRPVLDNDPPTITDTTSGVSMAGGQFTLTAQVTDNIALWGAYLVYTCTLVDGGQYSGNVSMDPAGGDVFTANITVGGNATLLSYRVSANDTAGNWGGSDWRSMAVNDSLPPGIEDVSEGAPVTGETYTVSASATDNQEVDTVRLYVYFDTASGVTTPVYVDMAWYSGHYEVLVQVPLDALTLYYTISANDTSGNWNITNVISRDVRDSIPPVAVHPASITAEAGVPVLLNGSGSKDNVAVVNYSWSFVYGGAEVTLYGAGPSFNFTTLGDYNVTLTVRDAWENNDSVMFLISVGDSVPPVADPGITLYRNVGQTATFDGSASHDNLGISNYTWTFQYNGTRVTLYGVNPQFTFWVAGTYNITLTVTDPAGNQGTGMFTVQVLGAGGGGIPWWLPVLLVIIIVSIIAAAALLLNRKGGPSRVGAAYPHPRQWEAPPVGAAGGGDADIMSKLDARYAKGEISEETYLELKAKYGGGSFSDD